MTSIPLKNKISNRILLHLLAVLIYIIYIYVANRFAKPELKVTEVLLYLIPQAIIFYTSLYALRSFQDKSIAWIITLIVILLAILSFLIYGYVYWFLPSAGMATANESYTEPGKFVRSTMISFGQYFAYALLYFFGQQSANKELQVRILQEDKLKLEQEKIQQQLENALLKQQELQAQQDKLQYEYAFLRAQINPHFLHNTLNVLFSQALTHSQSLADNILKLSNIMRYSLEGIEHESGKVYIQKELEHLQTLIDIHNMRFSNSKTIQYTVTGETHGHMLPPLSIITIVENAFKYGDLKDENHPLTIKVALQPQQINFYCHNKKKKKNIELSSHNIGITNLRKRLDVAFKNKYDMKVTDEEDFYTFELTIKINANDQMRNYR